MLWYNFVFKAFTEEQIRIVIVIVIVIFFFGLFYFFTLNINIFQLNNFKQIFIYFCFTYYGKIKMKQKTPNNQD